MSPGWAGPVWGEPSAATEAAVPLRRQVVAGQACYRADGGQSAEFVVLAASVAGVAHRLSGRRCEDAYAWALRRPGRLAMIVADGVSTAGRGVRARISQSTQPASTWPASRAGVKRIAWRPCEQPARQYPVRAGNRRRSFPRHSWFTLVSASRTGAEVCLARVGDSSAFVLAGAEWEELFPGRAEEELRGSVIAGAPARQPRRGRRHRDRVRDAARRRSTGAAHRTASPTFAATEAAPSRPHSPRS